MDFSRTPKKGLKSYLKMASLTAGITLASLSGCKEEPTPNLDTAENQTLQVHENSFCFRFDEQNVAIVIPENLLPETLKNHKNMSDSEIRKNMGQLMMDSEQAKKIMSGQLFIGNKKANLEDTEKIYRAMRRTGINMAKEGFVSVTGYDSRTIALADRNLLIVGNKVEQKFDERLKNNLVPLIRQSIRNSDQLALIQWDKNSGRG